MGQVERTTHYTCVQNVPWVSYSAVPADRTIRCGTMLLRLHVAP